MRFDADVPMAVAWALAWGALALVFLVVLALLLLRGWRWRELPRSRAFEATWQPLLMRCALGEMLPGPLPRLTRRERWHWMRLWLHLQMSLQGPSRQHLATLGRAMGLGVQAWARVRSSHQSERLVGMLALGFLRDPSSETLLLQALGQGANPVVVYASRALLEIDDDRHARVVAQALLDCPDLDMSLVSIMLKPFRRVLRQALSEDGKLAAGAASLPWLRLAKALQLQWPQQTLASCLKSDQDPEVLMAALRLVQGEQGPDSVVTLAQHGDWRVRAQAARVLAEIGTRAELPLLVAMTADAQWWVRYRAAQALLRLPGVNTEQVLLQVQANGDRFAQSMLQTVMAETSAAARRA